MIKKVIKGILLFLGGVILGTVMFLPRELLWSKALDYANQKAPDVNISWNGISDAGLMSFTLHDLHIQTKSKKTNVYVAQLGVELGIGTLLDLKIKTGPVMRVQVHRNKNIEFNGGLDLFALLRREDLKGLIDLKGEALMAEWTQPPLSGHVDIRIPEASLPGGFNIAEATGVGDLSGTVLAIPSFSTGKPLAAQGQGEIQLSFENFRESTYSVTGTAQMAGKDQAFKVAGKMGELGF